MEDLGTQDTRLSTGQRALCCLVHPSSLVALALLAFNDHWLKGQGPGWLTGKLSDFAGLYYFPFLVIAIAGLLSRSSSKSSFSSIRIGRIVFVGIGLCFASVKCIPAVHTATLSLVQWLLGEAAIVRDPSDIIALLSLWPAWRLYHKRTEVTGNWSHRLRPLTLGVAVLLTAATSKPRALEVTRVLAHNEVMLALVVDMYSSGSGRVYESKDGRMWTGSDVSEEIFQEGFKSKIVANGTTFEIRGKEVLSTESPWSLSARAEFMAQAGGAHWKAMDVATFQGMVVVALGAEGVLLWDGKWQRYAVGSVSPTTPTTTLKGALELVAMGQWIFGVCAMCIAWFLLSFISWCTPAISSLPKAQAKATRIVGRLRAGAQRTKQTLKSLRPTLGYTILTILSLLFPVAFFESLRNPIYDLLFFVFVSTPFVLLSMGLVGLGWLHHKKTHAAPSKHFYASMGCGIATLVFIVLWDIGWIDSMQTTFWLSATAIAAWVVVRAGRISSP